MWKPLEPDVSASWQAEFLEQFAQRNCRRAQGCLVRVRGSRSKTQMSGWSRSGTRETQTCGVMQFWLASHRSERVSLTSGNGRRRPSLGLHALEPPWKSPRHVLLDEPLLANPGRNRSIVTGRFWMCGIMTGATAS